MSCTFGCIKCLLFVVNFIVWLAGAGLLGIGAWARVDQGKFDILLGSEFSVYAAYILIGVGIFLFIVGFTGCCGAIRESKCLLGLYFTLVFFTLSVEVAACAFAYIFRHTAQDIIKKKIDSAMVIKYGYPEYRLVTVAIDHLQTKMKCCGISNYTDWIGSAYYTDPAMSLKRGNTTVPHSCCKKGVTAECNQGYPVIDDVSLINVEGCYTTFVNWIKNNLLLLGGVALGVALVQILAMIFSCCLCRRTKDKEDSYDVTEAERF
ncbi:unnamed protein product [Owenia fusiformis]|uniref:Tetraspanin n=1 Tax=Owenia fusiformis TaxID=6347 RepID=A0A8J1XVZ4_OWEFU|nr:unnamed protein product [Owenia fusiformis]